MFRILLVYACVYIACASVSFEYQTLPDNLEEGQALYCIDKSGNKRDLGENWDWENNCGIVTCLSVKENKVLLQYSGCGSVGATPDCNVTSDASKPYPDCCPKLKCE